MEPDVAGGLFAIARAIEHLATVLESARSVHNVPTKHHANKNATEPNQNSAMNQAIQWLLLILGQQPLPANQILADATRMGIAEITLRRAAKSLRIKKQKERFSGRWMWSLSNQQSDRAIGA